MSACRQCGADDCAGFEFCTINSLRAEVEHLKAALRSVLDRCTKEHCGADTPCGQCDVARAALVSNPHNAKSEAP